jgi:hypothetical protein
MFARALPSFHPAPLLASPRIPVIPIISTRARPFANSNHSRTYETRGGGWGCPGPTNRSARPASLLVLPRSNNMLQGMAPHDLLPLACPERSRRVTNHHHQSLSSLSSLSPAHCAPAPMVRESPHCWTWKHPAAPRCLIPRADKGWGRPHDALAQPSSASRPQVVLRRWGRKADRVRLGQRTLVG